MGVLRKLLHLPYKWILLLDFVSVPAVIAALSFLDGTDPAAVAAYILSAYALVVAAVNIKGIVRRIKELATGDEVRLVRFIKGLLRRNRYTKLYLESAEYRAEIGLYAGLAFDLLYAAIKGSSGLYYHSVWLMSVGVYYLVFALIRFFLMRNVRRRRSGTDKLHEWKTFRTCGVLLFAMNTTMAGMAVQMVRENRANQYSKTLVILSAAYTFYIFTLAFVNMIKFRRADNTILSAAKILAFVGAVMSMYSLQTSMLATFNDENDENFRRTANALTGAAVTVITLSAAVYMIIKGGVRIRRFTDAADSE